MRPDLQTHAYRQGGLVTRRQAEAAGYLPHELRSLTAPTGEWVVVRRGVYLPRVEWEVADERAQWLLRDRAVTLTTGPAHMLSHDSAARLHGLETLKPALNLVHVTRPDYVGTRTESGVKHHLGRIEPTNVEVNGIRVTSVARTAVDLAREHGLNPGVVACDAALRRGVTKDELRAELTAMRYWRGVTTARAAVDLSAAGAESVGETLTRIFVAGLGLGNPIPQFPFRLPSGALVWVDLLLGRHVIEFDGKIKYTLTNDGGYATSPTDTVWREKLRERELASLGLGISRVVMADLFGPARARTAERLRREYAVTLARFGSQLDPAMREFAAAVRPQRVA